MFFVFKACCRNMFSWFFPQQKSSYILPLKEIHYTLLCCCDILLCYCDRLDRILPDQTSCGHKLCILLAVIKASRIMSKSFNYSPVYQLIRFHWFRHQIKSPLWLNKVPLSELFPPITANTQEVTNWSQFVPICSCRKINFKKESELKILCSFVLCYCIGSKIKLCKTGKK